MPGKPFPDVADTTRKVMRANKGKDTKPELIVRRMVHGMGYRYRLHRRDLPGTPDLTFGPRRKVVFVHGCFWHGHDDPTCKVSSSPKTRPDYWRAKFERNKQRDAGVEAALHESGWKVLTLWECGLRDAKATMERLRAFIDEA